MLRIDMFMLNSGLSCRGIVWLLAELDVQPVPPHPRHQWRTAPRDLRSSMGRTDRGLLVLVPDQRLAERLAPEVAHLLRPVTGQGPDEPAVGEEVVARLD